MREPASQSISRLEWWTAWKRQSHGMLWYARCSSAWARPATNTAIRNCAHTGSDWMASFSAGKAARPAMVEVDAVTRIRMNCTSTWLMKK
ncbi:hypothetical protein FQZ97_1122570 [compost metagenome]